MAVKFCPLASGSSGNSIFIGTESTNILVDAGLSGKRIEAGLKEIEIIGEDIDAIFVTHEHGDHIQGVGILSRRFDIPIYATEKTWRYFERHNAIGKILPKNKVVVYSGEKAIVNDIYVMPFDIPHDSAEPVGYSIFAENKKISVATDIGHVTDLIKESICDSDILLIESNHDIEMLKNGSYPQVLKNRVLGSKGHLSNVSAGELIAEITSSKLKHVFLGHLSHENNRPIIAMDTVMNILTTNKIKVGKDFSLYLANRDHVSHFLEV